MRPPSRPLQPDLTRGTGLKIVVRHYLPDEAFGIHTDNDFRISIVLSGALLESTLRQDHCARPMSIALKSPDFKHSNRFGPKGAVLLSIEWDPDNPPEYLSLPGQGGVNWLHDAPAGAASARFLNRLKNADSWQTLQEDALLFMADLSGNIPATHAEPPGWLKRIEEQILDEFYRPVLVQDLAREAGVHPVYLARLFRRYYSCSIKEFLQEIRLREAISAVADGETPLSHIAFDAGFSDQSHLTRMFRLKTGASPAQFGKLIRKIAIE